MNPASLSSTAFHWDAISRDFSQVPLSELKWSALDLGVQYGAILVERIRTFGGRLPNLDLHLDRIRRGQHAFQMELPFEIETIPLALQRLLDCNAEWMSRNFDASIVFNLSPGNIEWGIGDCTCMIHLLPLPWKRLNDWYTNGAELIRSRLVTGAGACWPSDIKARSRLNYFLADRSATKSVNALSLLSGPMGFVADTSVANLLMITRGGDWISPLRSDIVQGTSLQIAERILKSQGISIEFRDIRWDELPGARELILVGNSGCAWHAKSIDGQIVPRPGKPPIACQMLQQLWIEQLGFDWLGQAKRLANA